MFLKFASRIGIAAVLVVVLLPTRHLCKALGKPLTEERTSTSAAGQAEQKTAPSITHRVMEAFPSALLAAIELRNRRLARIPGTVDGQPLESVFTVTQRWPQKSVLRVAFLDGDASLHKAVADAAQAWSQFCNIKFDFGLDPNTSQYRRWTTSDKKPAAEIRISFDRVGYWSLVGTDSSNPDVGNLLDLDGGRPYQRSMNYGGFKTGLPSDYRGTVIHEFGHALGFQHEHQHPTQGCDQDFRWLDDVGYVPTTDRFGQYIEDSAQRKPGIYTVLGGPPNNWEQSKVDFNLHQLQESHAYRLGPFDRKSIMKYYFDAWMFNSGENSHCFSAGENNDLSDGDKFAVSQEYPPDEPPSGLAQGGALEGVRGRNSSKARAEEIETQRRKALELLIKNGALNTEAKEHYEALQKP